MHCSFYRQAFLAATISSLIFSRSGVAIRHLLWNWIHVPILHRHHVPVHLPRPEPISEPLIRRGRPQHCLRLIHIHPSHRARVANATVQEKETRSPVHFPDCISVSTGTTPPIERTLPLKQSRACIASVLGMIYRVQQGKNDDTLWMLIPVLTTRSPTPPPSPQPTPTDPAQFRRAQRRHNLQLPALHAGLFPQERPRPPSRPALQLGPAPLVRLQQLRRRLAPRAALEPARSGAFYGDGPDPCRACVQNYALGKPEL